MEANARLAIVIMAAGKGTRLKSQRPKVLHEIGGKPLLAHVIAAASKIIAPSEIFVVIGHHAEKVRAAVASTGVSFVEQTEQLSRAGMKRLMPTSEAIPFGRISAGESPAPSF